MTQTFDNWTVYDDWLIQNYDSYAIYKIEDNEGKISIEYCNKDEFAAIKEQSEKKQ